MTTPILNFRSITFPGAAVLNGPSSVYNLSNLTSLTGTPDPLQGDNGSDFYYRANDSYILAKFQGGGRAFYDAYADAPGAYPARPRYTEPTTIQWSDSDTNPQGSINVNYDNYGSTGQSGVLVYQFAAGQLNCGLYADRAPVTRDLNRMIILGRSFDANSTWQAQVKFADSSKIATPLTIPSASDGQAWAFQIDYSSMTPTTLSFKAVRQVAGNSYNQMAIIVILILPTQKRKASTGIKNAMAQAGIFGGARYA